MITLEKLRVIAKSKFSRKDNLGTWYQDRLDICKVCPFNSANKEILSLKETAIVAANLGKPTCLGCWCEIDAKASVREETCGLAKLGVEPLWRALPPIVTYNFIDIKIENLSEDKVKINTELLIAIDYGTIKFGSDTGINLSLESTKQPITELALSMGCGCTTGISKKIDNKYFVNIKYDSTRLGEFSKTVIFTVTQNGVKNRIPGKIHGVVTK